MEIPMTIEEQVEKLKNILPPHIVDATKDWSVSDQLYFYLHRIQLAKMDELLDEVRALMRK
jgi:hypothetical protein